MGSAIGQKRDEHSTDCARGAPYYHSTAFYWPSASETSGGESGDGQASAILEAETVRDRSQQEGGRDDVSGTRSQDRTPANACPYGQAYLWPNGCYGARSLSADSVREWQPDDVVAGTDQGFSMVESGGRDFDERLAGLQRDQVLHANFNDFRSTGTQRASDTPPGGYAHRSTTMLAAEMAMQRRTPGEFKSCR
jgi:hypothetical protein